MISILPNWMPLAFQTGDAQSTLLSFVPMLVIMGIFYIVLFLPMRKRQKALAQMIDNLKRGDRVITNGGIYGEVAGVDAGTVILKIADNVKIKVAKSAIAGLEGKEGESQ